MNLDNMKVATRIGLGFGIVLLLLLIVGIIGYWGIAAVSGTTENIIRSDAKISENAASARANVLGLRRFEKDLYINMGSKEKEVEYLGKWKSEFEQLSATLNTLETLVTEQKDKDAVKDMKVMLATYESGFKKTIDGIHSGVIKTTQDGNKAIGEFKDAIHKLESSAKELAENGVKKMEAAEPAIGAIKKRSVSLLLILILAAIVIGVAFNGLIVRGIQKQLGGEPAFVSEVAQKVAEGDLTMVIETKNNDTTSVLASMRRMTDNLKAIMKHIEESSHNVASSSEELSSTVSQMSTRVNEQSGRANQIATAATELSQTVIDVARNASQMASSATDTLEIAGNGAEVVNKTVVEVQEIANTVNDLSTVMTSLGARSKQIGDISNVIKDIADQTNLLALNAAIEAARAGEQGRGFAVVADEVRKLAERTTTSTTEISEMISAMQNETQKAVGSMEKGRKKVEVGVELAKQAGGSLKEIVASANGLQSVVQHIASATEEMSTVSEGISGDIETIAEVAKEISVSANEIASGANGLASISCELRNQVKKFKLA
jgi:methyl-accepting chemotaxis protein